MSVETLEKKRKRLIFRSWHRGTREMDIIMGSFADKYVPLFDAALLDAYDALLQESDPDIYDWVCGREQVPASARSAVVEQLLEHHHARQS
jgi:antitoxin CptB